MINVVCVKWGDLYSSEYVNKLYRAVKRNTTLPFRFICFTENSNGVIPEVEIRPFIVPLTGWWNKVYLFSVECGLEGRVFYVDLDTVIAGNIDAHMSFSGQFAILRDFYADRMKKPNSFGSGLMSWNAPWRPHIWQNFIAETEKSNKGKGDQDYLSTQISDLENVTFWQDLFSETGKIVSFKVHVRDQPLPRNTSIICFHGKPRPHEVHGLPMMKEHWI